MVTININHQLIVFYKLVKRESITYPLKIHFWSFALTAQLQNQNATPTLISVGKDGEYIVLKDVWLPRRLQVVVHIRVLNLEGVVALDLVQ